MMTPHGRLVPSALLLGVALTATYPVFISTYRGMAFQTAPRDDYAPYLLWMAGEGGSVPGAPMCYRVLSVAVALPFHRVLPVYRFTNAAGVDPSYLRATQALAFVSWLALAGLAVLAFRIARDRLAASRAAALAASFAIPLYAGYTAVVGVDPVAMLLVAAGSYWLGTPAAFAAVVIVGAAFNEKVPLVLGLLLAGRALARPRETWRRHPVQLVACAAAVAGYVAVRAAWGAPGNEHQLQPLGYLRSVIPMLRLTLSVKGFLLNVFPVALCLAGYALVWRRRRLLPAGEWSRSDAIVPLGLAALGVAIDVQYTLGRLVLHSLPLIVPAAVVVAAATAGGAPAAGGEVTAVGERRGGDLPAAEDRAAAGG